jgi:hypothetical protein
VLQHIADVLHNSTAANVGTSVSHLINRCICFLFYMFVVLCISKHMVNINRR